MNIIILILLLILVIMMFFNRSKKYLFEMLKSLKEFLIKEFQLFLKNLIDYLAKIELMLSKKSLPSNDLSLEDLTANLIDEKNSKQLKTYLDALFFAVRNENVINIALTGGYGTGKSTIINQFCKKNRGNEYLHISLANFKDEKSDEKLIETSIVQQILYYEKKFKIKESSYKRIHFTKPLNKLCFVFLVVIWFYTFIFLFLESINSKIILFTGQKTSIQSIQLIFILGVIYILYKSFDAIKNIKFSKLTHNSLEIVNEKTDKDLSVFNRNIDEIIYFFEKTNTNVVIVEDIDRFSDDIAIKLYSKIRELSILIKQSKDVNQPVKFIYSVKDELILEDKTKFFDIIIPVIPITDYNNSKNMFLLKLDDFFEKEKIENVTERESKSYLDKNFLSEISNYVYDMRTVINICNEFKLYNKILETDKPNIDKNKLLAIIFYKNIFPDDFAKIQKNDSKLHRIFKKDFENEKGLEKIILEIDEKIKEKTEEKNKLENELNEQIVKDIDELRNIYIFNLISLINEKHKVIIKDIEKFKLGSDLVTDENFEKLKESSNIKFSYDYNNNYDSGISFKKVENKVNIELSYNKREKLIKDFHENKIDLLERRILYLNNEKQNIKNLSLYELCENYSKGLDQFLDLVYSCKIYKKVDGKEFLETNINPNISIFKYLFKNDYLNEDFIEYVSYFYLGSLSSKDHKLMMKINQNELTSFDEKIDNVDNLVKSTRDIRFKNSSILIYEIFEFLLKNCQDPNLRNQKLDFVLNQIQNYHDKSAYFLEGFLKKISNDNITLSNFYCEITKWDKFWNLVETKFSEELKRIVLFDLIQLFSDDFGDRTLIKLNKNKGITNFISKDKNFLNDIFEKISINSFIKTLKILEVQFNLITPDKKIKGLLLKVYEEDLYKVNIDNFKLFSQLDGKYHYDEDEFSASNFGFLRSNEDSKLYKRVCENLNGYIENVYLKIDENIKENVKDISFLISQKDEIINLKNKLEIVKKGFVGKLENFDGILCKEIQAQLLDKNKVLVSWEVILEYYSWEGSFDSILNNYLSGNDNLSLSVIELSNDVDIYFGEGENDSCMNFIYELINNENLSQQSFEVIFADSGDLVLSSNKIKIDTRIPFLEEKDFFVLDQEEIDSLKENNKDVLVKLIEKSEKTFISAIDTYNFEIEFIEDLLNSKVSIESLNAIIIYRESEIIENENLEFLKKIATFYIENKSLSFTSEMFEYLIDSDLDEKYKIGLFNLVASDENTEYEISALLEKMGDKFNDLLHDEKVSFDENEQNETFLKILEKNNIISKFVRSKSKGIYTVVYNI